MIQKLPSLIKSSFYAVVFWLLWEVGLPTFSSLRKPEFSVPLYQKSQICVQNAVHAYIFSDQWCACVTNFHSWVLDKVLVVMDSEKQIVFNCFNTSLKPKVTKYLHVHLLGSCPCMEPSLIFVFTVKCEHSLNE
jgi:hypothetical protein